MRVIEQHAPEIVRQDDVAVEMQPPAVVLEAAEPRVDRRALVEVASVLGEEIGLDANRAVLLRDLLRPPVLVARHHDQRVQVRMIQRQRQVEQVVKADAKPSRPPAVAIRD